MSFRTTFTTSSFYEDDDFEIPLEFEPADWIDPVFSEDKKTFVYASHHPSDVEYHWAEGVEFIQANSQNLNYCADPDEWVAGFDPANHDIFPVGIYEHGDIQYSLSGESVHSGCQFDYVSVGGFIAIPKNFTDTELAARSTLEEYTSWCNGDVYGIITMELDEEIGEWKEADSCWGFIGSQYVEEEMKGIVS